MSHIPVLIAEVLEALSPQAGETHMDATFGGGSYARAILQTPGVRLIALDRDPDAVARGKAMEAEFAGQFTMLEGPFGAIESHLEIAGVKWLDGIVLDIGVSSFQIDEAERGFSFMRDGPLDMRMGRAGVSAADIVNTYDEAALADVIYALGEEAGSRRVARAVVLRRLSAPFTRTLDLAAVVEDALGGRRGARTHPATRTFQALRMAVNDELGELSRALDAAERVLRPGGRLVVVTFHSLEDRLVKTFLRDRSGLSVEQTRSRHVPQGPEGPAPTFELISRKAVEPSGSELANNPRARSARLRAARRTEAPVVGKTHPSQQAMAMHGRRGRK